MCMQAHMIGAEDPTRPAHSKAAARAVASINAGAWVAATTHACVHRPSYLPGTRVMRDDQRPIEPKAFDLMVNLQVN